MKDGTWTYLTRFVGSPGTIKVVWTRGSYRLKNNCSRFPNERDFENLTPMRAKSLAEILRYLEVTC